MYVLIDPSEKDTLRFVAFDERSVREERVPAPNRALLASLDAFLGAAKKEQQPPFDSPEIEGVAVVVGTGGFTSTRIAVTVANSFGYALGIPLLAVTARQAESPQSLVSELQKQTPGVYISARYSAPPSITPPNAT